MDGAGATWDKGTQGTVRAALHAGTGSAPPPEGRRVKPHKEGTRLTEEGQGEGGGHWPHSGQRGRREKLFPMSPRAGSEEVQREPKLKRYEEPSSAPSPQVGSTKHQSERGTARRLKAKSRHQKLMRHRCLSKQCPPHVPVLGVGSAQHHEGQKKGNWMESASQLSVLGAEPAQSHMSTPLGKTGMISGQGLRSCFKGKAGKSLQG